MIFVLSGGIVPDVFVMRNLINRIRGPINIGVIPFATSEKKVVMRSVEDEVLNNYRFFHPHKEYNLLRVSVLGLKYVIQHSDLIVVPGGNGELLMNKMLDLEFRPDWINLNSDKIYVGWSAGANLPTRCYFSNDEDAVKYGLGLIDIGTMCHYQAHKFEKFNSLVNNRGNIYPVIPLSNNDVIVLEVRNGRITNLTPL